MKRVTAPCPRCGCLLRLCADCLRQLWVSGSELSCRDSKPAFPRSEVEPAQASRCGTRDLQTLDLQLNVSDPPARGDDSEPQQYGNQTRRTGPDRRHGIVVPFTHTLVSNLVENERVYPSDQDQQHLDLEPK